MQTQRLRLPCGVCESNGWCRRQPRPVLLHHLQRGMTNKKTTTTNKCLYENCVHDGNTKQPHPSDHVSTRLPGDPGSSFVLTPPRQPWDHVYLHPGSWITAPAAMHHRSWIHASWPHASSWARMLICENANIASPHFRMPASPHFCIPRIFAFRAHIRAPIHTRIKNTRTHTRTHAHTY